MEALRKNDALERANETEYGWRDILMEELRLNREEYLLLTDHTLPLLDLYGFPPGTSPDELRRQWVAGRLRGPHHGWQCDGRRAAR
jgi:hypothetical protein